MATSKIEVTEGTGTNVATHTITEGMETRHLSRVVVSNASGSDIALATDAKLDDIITALGSPVGLTDAELRADPIDVSADSLPLPTGASTSAKQDTMITAIDDLATAINDMATEMATQTTAIDNMTTAINDLVTALEPAP